MLHKNSISVKEFVDIHNSKIKRKISKKDLSKNLRQIIKMENVTLNLKNNPEIEVTLPCVVDEIDFGNLTFHYDLIDNITEINRYNNAKRDNDYYSDDEIAENLNLKCYSERWGDEDYVAPHIDRGWVCFGEFNRNLFAYFLTYDYANIANTLKDFIKSMNQDSHYYDNALCTNLLTCYRCEDIIKPIVYKHSLPEGKRNEIHYCEHCIGL